MSLIYSITFEISDGNNKAKLINKIASSFSYARVTQNTYFVVIDNIATPNINNVFIRDSLKEFVRTGDKLYVGIVKAPAAWFGLENEVSEWLRAKLTP
jgi:hypothetical protein